MNENEKNDANFNNIQKNLQKSFNQQKITSNKSYNESTKLSSFKEKMSNNFYSQALNDSFDKIDENPNQVVSKILDNINKNSLSTFYDSESEFKNKIDSLNLKFYLETEKYLCNQNKKIKTQTSLFIILFKQIIIYIEEIERLNLIIINKKYKPENIIKRTDNIAQKQKEFQTKEDIINALKKSQSNMEAKLLKALINENNLNRKIESLQKEVELYKTKLISLKNKSSFCKDKKEYLSDSNNSNNINNNNINNNNININVNNNINNNINNNVYRINKKKNSHNSVCLTNSSKNQIKNIIKINKAINIKSKSPSNFINKKSSFKLQNIKNINSNINRNLSEKEEKSKTNKEKNNNQINKNNLKIQNIEDVKYSDDFIIDLNKGKIPNLNTKRIKADKNNNTIDISENDTDSMNKNGFKKIIISNKGKINRGDNMTFRNIKKNSNNLNINLLLSNSNISSNTNSNNKKAKNDCNANKCIYTCYNTITNYNNKFKSDNAFNCLKLVKNNKKGKLENNNYNNQYNNNLNRVININMINDQRRRSNSLLKKEKSNKNKIKNIINISNSVGINKENNTINTTSKKS